VRAVENDAGSNMTTLVQDTHRHGIVGRENDADCYRSGGTLCRRYHIRRRGLFGSTLKGAKRPDSDVDLLVEFDRGDTRVADGGAAAEVELER